MPKSSSREGKSADLPLLSGISIFVDGSNSSVLVNARLRYPLRPYFPIIVEKPFLISRVLVRMFWVSLRSIVEDPSVIAMNNDVWRITFGCSRNVDKRRPNEIDTG